MRKIITVTIFNRYKIPLPLVNPDKMTLANLDSARLNLYDYAVIPFADRIFAELTKFLGKRFKLTENQLIVPVHDKIPALVTRRGEELKRKKDLGIFTINELREGIGSDLIKEGGDVVYIPTNLVPAGSAPETSDQTEEGDTVKTTRAQFVKIMKAQVDIKGVRMYPDEDIESIADEEGLDD